MCRHSSIKSQAKILLLKLCIPASHRVNGSMAIFVDLCVVTSVHEDQIYESTATQYATYQNYCYDTSVSAQPGQLVLPSVLHASSQQCSLRVMEAQVQGSSRSSGG